MKIHKGTTAMLVIVFIFFAQHSYTQVVTVGKDPLLSPDYTEIQQAIDSSASGTTIYVYPGSYNGFTIKQKQLNIIGPGYFLAENPETQVFFTSAVVNGAVRIDTMSNGSTLQGLQINSSVIVILSNGSLVNRCKMNGMTLENSNNVRIVNNYISGNSPYSCGTHTIVSITGISNNILFRNNFIQNGSLGWQTPIGNQCFAYYLCISTGGNTSCNFENNVIYGNFSGSNTRFENNILHSGTNRGCGNCYFSHNISHEPNSFGLTNGNDTINMSQVFVGTGSTDGKWQLTPTSPAKGMASDSGDPGMFGGSEPYVLSGLPAIPAIHYFQAPDNSTTNEKLPVHIKIKTH